MNNVPGLNMKNAFGQIFTGLDGRDDFVLENAKGPVSCRLLVCRLIDFILVKNAKLKPVRPLTSSPGTLLAGDPVKCEFTLLAICRSADVFTGCGPKLEEGICPNHEEQTGLRGRETC